MFGKVVDMRLIERESRGYLRAGQDLVVAGYTGLEGSVRIAKAREEQLRAWFSEDYVRQMRQDVEFVIDQFIPWKEYGAAEWEEVGEGGIFTALWTLSGAYQKGFQVDLYQIPIKQETIEVCERYDLNPYRLLSGNCMLAASDHGYHLSKRLNGAGIPAAVIGVVNPDIKRIICYGQVRGFLERPREDELYKLIPGAKSHEA